MIDELRFVPELRFVIVGTDTDPDASGRFTCDYFYTVPEPFAPTYVEEMFAVVEQERPQVILPENREEAQVLAENVASFNELNAIVLASSAEVVEMCNRTIRSMLQLTPGQEEYVVDCLCRDGRLLLATVRTREDVRSGVSWRGELVHRPILMEMTEEIVATKRLSWCVSLKFIAGKLIGINPCISTLIYQRNFSLPYLAIQLALGEITEDEVRSYADRVPYGLRFVRYVDQFTFTPKKPEAVSWTGLWRRGTVPELTDSLTTELPDREPEGLD